MAVYACSDLHGDWELWTAIKNFLQPDDILYFIGDATDRGDLGWIILKEALADKRIIYIAGNHDIMLADRIGRPNDYRIANLHHMNGGEPTWEMAENDPEAGRIKVKIRLLPKYAIYENIDGYKIFMSHSGSTDIEDEESLIWDRSEYLSRYKPDGYDLVVHGHTTIPHLMKDLHDMNAFRSAEQAYEIPEWEGGAYFYNNWRCDIDCYTVATRMTVLLNLDTFDEEIFQV